MKARNDQDLLAAFHTGSYATVIPVSCDIEPKTSRAVMGTGIGKRASQAWPELPIFLGKFLSVGGAHTYVVPIMRQPNAWTVCVPVRYTFKQQPDLALIEVCARELLDLTDTYRWEKVFIPRFGCGPGALDWKTTVRPVIADLLDDRFVVVHMDDPAPPTPAKPPQPAVKVGAVSKAAAKRMKK